MTISKLVAGQKGDVLNSHGGQVRDTVNALVDLSTGVEPFENITLKGLPQTAGAPTGYGDLASAIANSKNVVYTLGTIGDSRLANAYVAPAPGLAKSKVFQNQMTVTWLRALSGQRVDMPSQFSLATSGANTIQILAQAQAMASLSAKPDFCLINGGANDLATTATAAAMELAFNNLTSAVRVIRAAGIMPILEIDVPRTTASWTANASTLSAALNRKLRIWCSENDVLLCDYEQMYIVPATGEPAAGFNVADGIHSGCVGSSVRATQYLRCIEQVIGKHFWRMASPRDTYNQTLNTGGNMLANGLFLGTAGVSNGSGASGVVADSWQNRVISGTMTAVASKLAPESADLVSQRQQFVLNFTTAGEHRLQPQGVGSGATLPAGLAPGDLIYAEADVEIIALSGVVTQLALQIFDFVAADLSYAVDMHRNIASGNPLPVVPLPAPNGVGNIYSSLKLRLKTPVMVYGDGGAPTQLNWRMTTLGDAGASITFIASNAQLRKV